MRSIIIIVIAALFFVNGATAQDSVPANGTPVVLKPTNTGYAAYIFLPANTYTAASATSFDPAIARFLNAHAEPQQLPSPPAARSTDDADKKLAPAVTDQTQQTQPKTFARVVLIALNSGAVPQGSYRFTLKLEGPTPPIERELLLSVPASQLDTIDTLVVVSEWAKWYGEAVTSNAPQIWETSQKNWLTNITFDQKGQTEAGTDPAGRIKPKSGKLDDLSPGKHEIIRLGQDYELDGHFPLGTAKGKLVVNADQLSNPVTFNFEVRSRVWVFWVFPTMFVGLVAGYAARHLLADFLSRSQERRKCYDLIALIGSTLQQKKDSIFQAAAVAAQTKALEATKKTAAADIKAAYDDAQTAFQTATTELKTRRDGLTQLIGQLKGLTDAPYLLPEALEEALKAARTDIDTGIAGKLTEDDVVAAAAAFTVTGQKLQKAATNAGAEWIKADTKIDRIVALLGPALGLDGSDLQQKRKAVVDPVQTAVTALAVDTTGSIPLLKALLDALHGNIYALGQLCGVIAASVGDRLDSLTRALDGKQLPNPKSWQDWLDASRQFATALAKLSPRDPDSDAVYDAGSPLPKQLANAVLSQTSDQTLQTELGGLLNQNKVVEAVAKLAAALQPVPDEGKLKGATPMVALTEVARGTMATSASAALITGAPAPIVLAQSLPASTGPDPAAIAQLQARIGWEIETAGLLQTAIFGILIVCAGYFLFATNWVGTLGDFAAVLFWAFWTDIGADAASAATKNYTRRT